MTRIIAGRFRGRRLSVPDGLDVRPTTDRMRERLFSILGHPRYPAMAGAQVADIYAGTGALGLEALSRGAVHVTFVEKARGSLNCLRSNIASLDATPDTTTTAADATTVGPSKTAFDFIFIDPPYRKSLLRPTLDRLIKGSWLKDDTCIVCELAADETIDLPSDLTIVDDRKQGKQRIVILMQSASNI